MGIIALLKQAQAEAEDAPSAKVNQAHQRSNDWSLDDGLCWYQHVDCCYLNLGCRLLAISEVFMQSYRAFGIDINSSHSPRSGSIKNEVLVSLRVFSM